MVKKKSSAFLLFKMGLRTIKHNIAQFLAVIAIGAIAVTLFVGLLANAQSFENRINTTYKEGNLADLFVTTLRYDKEDETQLKSLLEDKANVDSRFYLPATMGTRNVNISIVNKDVTISKPFGEMVLDENADKDDYFYIDIDLYKNNTSPGIYKLGDEVSLEFDISSYGLDAYSSYLDLLIKEGGSNILANNTVKITHKVTGFMNHPENIEKSSYNSSIVMMSDIAFKGCFEKILNDNYTSLGVRLIRNYLNYFLGFGTEDDTFFTVPNQYLIKLKDGASLNDIKGIVEDYYSSKSDNNLYLAIEKEKMPFFMTINNDATQARQFTFVFPFVFFIVAILVILTTMSQVVLKDRVQIGTLKAIGIKNRTIYLHYIGLTSSLVALGTLIGEILGPIIIPRILGQKYNILYSLPKMTYVFPILYGILTAIVFLLLGALVTYFVCRNEVKLKPVESMRPLSPKIKFSGKAKDEQKVAKLSIKMAFRNLRINKVKTMMVIIGILGCTALLCCGFGIEDTIYHGVDHDMTNFNNSAISINYDSGKTYDEAMEILSFDGVVGAEPFTNKESTIYKQGGNQTLTNIFLISKDESHIKLDFKHDVVAISKKVSRNTNAKVGDKIKFTLNNKTFESKVGLIYDAFIYNGLMIFTDNPVLSEEKITYSSCWIDIAEGQNPADMKEKLLDNYSYIRNAQTQSDWQGYVEDVMSGVIVMTNAVKVFAILLALVVLYNLSLMNFKDRTRNIATLKVLGFSVKEITLSLMFETMTITTIGVAIGLLLGFPFLLAVMKTNIVELVEYLFKINVLSYVYSFLLTFVVSFVVNILFSLKTRNIKMVESLKSVE